MKRQKTASEWRLDKDVTGVVLDLLDFESFRSVTSTSREWATWRRHPRLSKDIWLRRSRFVATPAGRTWNSQYRCEIADQILAVMSDKPPGQSFADLHEAMRWSAADVLPKIATDKNKDNAQFKKVTWLLHTSIAHSLPVLLPQMIKWGMVEVVKDAVNEGACAIQ